MKLFWYSFVIPACEKTRNQNFYDWDTMEIESEVDLIIDEAEADDNAVVLKVVEITRKQYEKLNNIKYRKENKS